MVDTENKTHVGLFHVLEKFEWHDQRGVRFTVQEGESIDILKQDDADELITTGKITEKGHRFGLYDTLLGQRRWFGWQKFYEEKAREPFFRYVEVGVWKGISIVFLAKELLKREEPFELFAVDLWNDIQFHPEIHLTASDYEKQNIYEIYNYNLQKNEVRNSIKDIQGFSDESASQFEDETVDFMFLDANHTPEAAKKDIQAWLPKIKQGGILAGHDAKKVSEALTEIFGENVKRHHGNIWEHRK